MAEFLCSKCIGDENLSKWVSQNGDYGKCEFDPSHKGRRKVVSCEDFAERFRKYFDETYQIAGEKPTYYDDNDKAWHENYGETLDTIIYDDVGCEDEISHEIQRYLDLEDVNYETQYAANERHEAEMADYWDYWEEYREPDLWKNFCHSVTYQHRFFKFEPILDRLFESSEVYTIGSRRPIYHIPVGTKIYRARNVNPPLTPKQILEDPQKELGPPPIDKASSGRMNVQYIPIFYGAFSEETAVVETQPFIGELTAVGEFTLTTELKVFDFTIFDPVNDPEKNSDDDTPQDLDSHQVRRTINYIQRQISKPASTITRPLLYLPTQVLTEYIRNKFGVDAIIYFSSLTVKTNEASRNIVIFETDRPPWAGGNVLRIEPKDVKWKRVTGIQWHLEDSPPPEPWLSGSDNLPY